MILKEKRLEDMRIVWYLKNETTYIIKIKGEEFKIVRKITPKFKMKDLSRILKVLSILTIYTYGKFFYSKYEENINFYVENQEVIGPLISWDYLSEEQKEKELLEKIESLLEKNPNVDQEEQEIMMEGYSWYLPQYAKYMNRQNVYETLYASLNVQIKKKAIQKARNEEAKEERIIVASHDPKEHKIYYSEKSQLFHEKIHADNWNSQNNTYEENLFGEAKSAFASKDDVSYDDLRCAVSLIGELVGTDEVAKSLTQNDPEKIWDIMKLEFKENKQEIEQLRSSLTETYKCRYIFLKDYKEYKEKFWESYEILYMKKYGKDPMKDKIISFLKEIFFGEKDLLNRNILEYQDKFRITKDIWIDTNDREGNFREEIVKKAKEENNSSLLYYEEKYGKEIRTYQELKENLGPYYSEKRIDNLVDEFFCTKENSQKQGLEIAPEQKDVTLKRTFPTENR